MDQALTKRALQALLALLVAMLLAFGLAGCDDDTAGNSGASANTAAASSNKNADNSANSNKNSNKNNNANAGKTNTSTAKASSDLTFRSYSLMKSHYEKHGIDMGFASMEDYLAAANEVVADPTSLHKIEKEDGDDVYYREKTNDFVVVSTDGYIRTYFRPDSGKKYYDKQ